MFFSEGWRNLPFFCIYKNMALIDLAIKDFNEGDYDLIETAFNGDIFSFFNYANKRGKPPPLAISKKTLCADSTVAYPDVRLADT